MPTGKFGLGNLDSRYERAFMKNVRDYGATADGTTDDTDAVKSARDACDSIDMLFFPRGRYYLSDTIEIDNNLSVIGTGPGTQIFMANDLDLFNFTGAGFARVSDMRLGSAATSADKCLVKLNNTVSHYIIDNVWMIGGYYGIGMYGAMFGTLRDLASTASFYRGGTSANQAWIHGERSGGRSINGTSIRNCKMQGGVRGIEITDTNNEVGGLEIAGGLIEAQSDAAIYLSGIVQAFGIHGVHFESSQANVELVSCQNGSVTGCFLGGGQGVILTSCKRIRVGESYAWEIHCDDNSYQCVFENILYPPTADSGLLDINGGMITCANFENTGGFGYGSYGMYDGPSPSALNPNGDLESWAGGVPVGYTAGGTVAQETTVKRSGSSSAKLTASGSGWNILRYNLPAYKFGQRRKTVSIRAYAYKPTGGANPRIGLYWNAWATGIATQDFSLDDDTWTPICATFNVSAGSYSDIFVIIGSWAKPSGAVLFLDDILISEEQF